MFVFYVLNSYRRLFQRFLLGYNWSSHQTIQLVLSWSRLVFVLVWLTCFNCNLFSSLSPGCFSFLYCLREGKYVPTFFNKVVCILNFCFYFVEGYITWYKEKYIYIYIFNILNKKTHCRRLCKTTEIFVTIENVFFYLIFTLTHLVFGFLIFVYLIYYI